MKTTLQKLRDQASVMRRHNMGISQSLVLAKAADKPSTMTHISEESNLHPVNITGLVDNLEKEGLVVRQPDSDDRRKVIVAATPIGREVMNQIEKALEGGRDE